MSAEFDEPIAVELLAILRCPQSHEALRLADAGQLAAANKRIQAGTLRHADAALVTEPLRAALCSASGDWLYRVAAGIPILLASSAIVLGEAAQTRSALRDEKAGVQAFYDASGWTQDAAGVYVDAARWEDLRPVSAAYIQACHERLGEIYQAGGDYFLDVASGPIQYPEYLQYSAKYRHRVCVDLSYRALLAAREKLTENDLCVLADITNLPFADNSFAGIVSLHTIYHVAADEQKNAFLEIHRVQKIAAAAAVVYSWGRRAGLMQLAFLAHTIVRWPFRQLYSLARIVKRALLKPRAENATGRGEQILYFRPHDYKWFTAQAWPFRYEIRSWRSVSVNFLRVFMHAWLGGRMILRWVFRRENTAAKCCGQHGQYPLIILHKDDDV